MHASASCFARLATRTDTQHFSNSLCWERAKKVLFPLLSKEPEELPTHLGETSCTQSTGRKGEFPVIHIPLLSSRNQNSQHRLLTLKWDVYILAHSQQKLHKHYRVSLKESLPHSSHLFSLFTSFPVQMKFKEGRRFI